MGYYSSGAIPGLSLPTQGNPTRSLNTAFQVSATKDSLVVYSIQITVTASIVGGQNGDVILETASDAAFTSNVMTCSTAGLGQTYTLAIALQGVQPQTCTVIGWVPAGYWARIRTSNNVATPSYSFRGSLEATF